MSSELISKYAMLDCIQTFFLITVELRVEFFAQKLSDTHTNNSILKYLFMMITFQFNHSKSRAALYIYLRGLSLQQNKEKTPVLFGIKEEND